MNPGYWRRIILTSIISLVSVIFITASHAYDVRVTPNDSTEDGASLTTPNLFTTEIDTGAIFDDGFEGN